MSQRFEILFEGALNILKVLIPPALFTLSYLIKNEQGVGDHLTFLRFRKKERGDNIFIENMDA